MKKSTHQVEVVPVIMEPHPNADSLSVVRVHGYTVCTRTDDWKDHKYGLKGTLRHILRFGRLPQRGPLGAYIPPDSVVPDDAIYDFLDGHRRIKVKKLRGVISMGLLMPAPEGSIPGDDVAEQMGITHYEPEVHSEAIKQSRQGRSPAGFHPIYEVDTIRRYEHMFQPGEQVWVTEKIHGMNARYTFQDGKMFCGSHNTWKEKDAEDIYWHIFHTNPGIGDFCRTFPGYTLYGEIYGVQKGFMYGTAPGEFKFAAFDLLTERGTWVSPQPALIMTAPYQIPWVPFYRVIPFDMKVLEAMAEGVSVLSGDHPREGVVVKPVEERSHRGSRVNLKLVGNGYFLSQKN